MSNQVPGAPMPAGGSVPIPQANVGFGGLQTKKKRRWDASIGWFNFPKDAYCTLRFFGPVFEVKTHWIRHKKSQKAFPMICPCSNPLVETTSDSCPIEKDFDPYNSDNKQIKDLQAKGHAYAHAIVRNSTENPPWKPVKIALSVLMELQKKKGLNKCVIDGVTYEADLSDPYWGRDINIFYDNQTNNPQQKYSLDLGQHSPLTELELSYVDQLYDWPNVIEFPTFDEVKEALTANGFYQLLQGGSNIYVPPVVPPAQVQAEANFHQQVAPQAPQAPTIPPPVANTGFSSVPPVPPQSQPVTGHMPPPPSTQTQANGVPPQNVPPSPIPSAPSAAPAQANSFPDEDIPFSQASATTAQDVSEAANSGEKKWVVKGKPDGVTTEEFQKIITTYCDNAKIDRARPAKTWSEGELTGFQVLQCYGHYRGDIGCVKCPLRTRCLHEQEK